MKIISKETSILWGLWSAISYLVAVFCGCLGSIWYFWPQEEHSLVLMIFWGFSIVADILLFILFLLICYYAFSKYKSVRFVSDIMCNYPRLAIVLQLLGLYECLFCIIFAIALIVYSIYTNFTEIELNLKQIGWFVLINISGYIITIAAGNKIIRGKSTLDSNINN